MKHLVDRVRSLRQRYRLWRETRRQERMREFIEMANRPENIARRRREKERESGRLFLDDDGFHLLKAGQRKLTLKWSDVRKIETYKRDFFSYDSICLAFETGDDEWTEITEDMVDFRLVGQRMRELFSEIAPDWYYTVMQPPFETNQTVLWRRIDSPDAGETPS